MRQLSRGCAQTLELCPRIGSHALPGACSCALAPVRRQPASVSPAGVLLARSYLSQPLPSCADWPRATHEAAPCHVNEWSVWRVVACRDSVSCYVISRKKSVYEGESHRAAAGAPPLSSLSLSLTRAHASTPARTHSIAQKINLREIKKNPCTQYSQECSKSKVQYSLATRHGEQYPAVEALPAVQQPCDANQGRRKPAEKAGERWGGIDRAGRAPGRTTWRRCAGLS